MGYVSIQSVWVFSCVLSLYKSKASTCMRRIGTCLQAQVITSVDQCTKASPLCSLEIRRYLRRRDLRLVRSTSYQARSRDLNLRETLSRPRGASPQVSIIAATATSSSFSPLLFRFSINEGWGTFQCSPGSGICNSWTAARGWIKMKQHR